MNRIVGVAGSLIWFLGSPCFSDSDQKIKIVPKTKFLISPFTPDYDIFEGDLYFLPEGVVIGF